MAHGTPGAPGGRSSDYSDYPGDFDPLPAFHHTPRQQYQPRPRVMTQTPPVAGRPLRPPSVPDAFAAFDDDGPALEWQSWHDPRPTPRPTPRTPSHATRTTEPVFGARAAMDGAQDGAIDKTVTGRYRRYHRERNARLRARARDLYRAFWLWLFAAAVVALVVLAAMFLLIQQYAQMFH